MCIRDRLNGAGGGGAGTNSLTPELVANLPGPIRDAILDSYNDGLMPVLRLMVPLVILALLVMLPLREDKLKETVD